MIDWSLVQWIAGCVSIATVALYLLDRAHRAAIAEMKDSCIREQSSLQKQIDELKKQVGNY